MTSPAKKDSNGRNAKKSTGPRSEETKKRSCMNALKHGLTASLAMLPDEDPAAYEDRLRSWIAIWKPRDSLELYRVQRRFTIRGSSSGSSRPCRHGRA